MRADLSFFFDTLLSPRSSTSSGMKLTKAYTYLADVQEHKQVIPFRRFAGGIGRAGQAKQFGTTKGQSSLSTSSSTPYASLVKQVDSSTHRDEADVLVSVLRLLLSCVGWVETGRWPEKSVRFILRLLKNAESNAEAKDIAVEDLIIKNICVQQAPVRSRSCRRLGAMKKRSRVRKSPS